MEGPQSGRVGVRRTWALLALLVLGTFAWVATPALLLRPFKAQTTFGVALAYELRQGAPLVTLVGLILSLPLLARLARRITRRWQWAPLVALAVVAGSSAWLARQNHFEWMFNPLPDPTYAPASLVRGVDDRDMVVAVEIGSDAVAWPVLQMAYHHLVQDKVGGVPVVSTY
jgi:hypothetical protein